MIWTKWPYWVRGGVIGGGVALLSASLTNLCEIIVLTPTYTGLGIECMPFSIPWIPFWFIFQLQTMSTTFYTIFGTIVWFLIGSFIGYLVGLNKKRAHL